jgi:DNA-binding transcriptional ArsR family regulator
MPKSVENEARRIVLRLLVDIIHNSRDMNWPELQFPDAVCSLILAGEIIAAEVSGKPISEQRLAEIVEMPRATLHRRLDYLVDAGFVTRSRAGLHVDHARLKPESIRKAVTMVFDAAEALAKMDLRKS